MFACETLFICVIIRSAFQSRHLLCLQDFIRGESRIEEEEEEEEDGALGGGRGHRCSESEEGATTMQPSDDSSSFRVTGEERRVEVHVCATHSCEAAGCERRRAASPFGSTFRLDWIRWTRQNLLVPNWESPLRRKLYRRGNKLYRKPQVQPQVSAFTFYCRASLTFVALIVKIAALC